MTSIRWNHVRKVDARQALLWSTFGLRSFRASKTLITSTTAASDVLLVALDVPDEEHRAHVHYLLMCVNYFVGVLLGKVPEAATIFLNKIVSMTLIVTLQKGLWECSRNKINED